MIGCVGCVVLVGWLVVLVGWLCWLVVLVVAREKKHGGTFEGRGRGGGTYGEKAQSTTPNKQTPNTNITSHHITSRHDTIHHDTMNRRLESWVQKTFQPCIMVAATAAVEATCAKNNLSFADLLKPLGATLENVGGWCDVLV